MSKISEKVYKLKGQLFDLGSQKSDEVKISSGGDLQQFENANIYWHPIMISEAHEVHGAILIKYLSMGGHDKDPVTGQRLLGYPKTDVYNSWDHMCRTSLFEWGSIYAVFGTVVVYGKIHDEYLKSDGAKGSFGYPLADPVKLSDGLVSYFEHGCMYVGNRTQDQVIKILYKFPKMGHPWMVNSSQIDDKSSISFSFNKASMTAIVAEKLLQEIFAGRIFIRETATSNDIGLNVKVNEVINSIFPGVVTFKSVFNIQGAIALKNKQLYDIVLKLPNKIHSVSPHAIYIRESWSDFKFIHVTDLHVSRRLDRFRKFFTDMSMEDAVRNFNNFNDNFRQFIKYANKLQKLGQLDFIIVTGDLVDYTFEDGGKFYNNNNHVYFENIVRGLTGKPDQIENEELKVPIFTSLGNHDYRTRPYYPLFTVDVQWPASNMTMEQFASFNLTKDEAKVVTEKLLNIDEMVSSGTALEMTRPDKENKDGSLDYYFTHICRENSYVVTLDNHQIVMIDGKWDDGVIEGGWDALVYYLGFKGESSDNYVGGSPDSVGFVQEELDMVTTALKRDGLVIVGVHNPIINFKDSEYPYFTRESVRAARPTPVGDIRKFLFRHDPMSFAIGAGGITNGVTIDLRKDNHKGWSRGSLPKIYEGILDDLLDYGVMRKNREDFLKICSGVKNATRSADLILSGHVHKNWECRVEGDSVSQNFKIAQDFYTESPTKYYHSYDTNINPDKTVTISGFFNRTGLAKIVSDRQIRIHVIITEEASVNEIPVQGSSGIWSIKSKPTPFSLNAQKNALLRKLWWQIRRPLLVQTAALGPSEFLRAPERQPDFRGCRLISVAENIMETIKYVTIEEMKIESSATAERLVLTKELPKT